jgi:hypothetical protein
MKTATARKRAFLLITRVPQASAYRFYRWELRSGTNAPISLMPVSGLTTPAILIPVGALTHDMS